MRHLLTLLAATSVLACHSRNEDETAAAPDRDTTAVTHAIDTTRTGPPGEAGRPGNATVTLDSVMHDSTNVKPDSAMPDTVSMPMPSDTTTAR
jgi:hypothetical protein